MIRGELIQAKSVHVGGEHQREVMALGKIRARDARARELVRGHEDRFWREIARASSVLREKGKASRSERASALNRAIEAHCSLSKARSARREATGEVQRQVARVIKMKHTVAAFEKLRTKERTRRVQTHAERRAEEVDEIAALRRVMGPTRRGSSLLWRDELVDGARSEEALTRAPAFPIHSCRGDVRLAREVASGAEEKRLSSLVGGAEFVAPNVSLHEVCGEVSQDVATLRVRVERAGAPLSCRLESAPLGRVGIVVEAAHPTLVTSLEREQRGILQRLSEMGVKVGGFEIRREQTMRGALSGFLRRSRPPQEEDDENVIA